jgi:hypothetical protein
MGFLAETKMKQKRQTVLWKTLIKREKLIERKLKRQTKARA